MTTHHGSGSSGTCSGRPDERGATLVEYAMLVALVVVLLLGVLQALADDSGDELEARADRSGAPDLSATGAGPPPTGGGGGPTNPGTDPTTPAINVKITGPTGCWKDDTKNKEWAASFMVVVLDQATDLPVDQALVSARLRRINVDGETVIEVVEPNPQETLPDGTAHFALVGLRTETGPDPDRTGSVVFELTGITGVDPPVNYTVPEPPPSVVVRAYEPGGACS